MTTTFQASVGSATSISKSGLKSWTKKASGNLSFRVKYSQQFGIYTSNKEKASTRFKSSTYRRKFVAVIDSEADKVSSIVRPSSPLGINRKPSRPQYKYGNLPPPRVPDLKTEKDALAEVVLFCTEETKTLAQSVAAASPEGHKFALGTVRWKTFEDGFPDLFIEDAVSLRNRHVAFIASFHSPQVIFEQLSVIYALPRMFVASFTLVLPFFPTGTAERIEDEGEVATAASMARVLSCIPLSRGGPTSLLIYDIHALQERFYFGDSVLPYFQSAIPLLKAELERHPDRGSITIAYPDEGAWKRFHNMFDEYAEVVCTKVRDGDKRLVRLKEGDASGRHVVIVDDLVQSGGTLIECNRVLSQAGAKHVSAFVTHAVFPNNSFERFQPEEECGSSETGFAHFWITDSCPQTIAKIAYRRPFEVLSLAESIAECLRL